MHNIKVFIDYELKASPIISFLFFNWLLNLYVSYVSWKVLRKYRRYEETCKINREILEEYKTELMEVL